MLHPVNQDLAPRNRDFSPGWTNYIPLFLWILGFLLRNCICNVTPQVFNGVEVGGLSWPLHYLNPFGLEPRCCSLTLLLCLGSLSCWNTHFSGIYSSAYGNIISSSTLMYSNWFMVDSIWKIGPTLQYEKHPHTMIFVPPCFTVYCGLNSVPGGRLMYCRRPLDLKRTILLSSFHRMLRHFSLGQSIGSMAKFEPILHMPFFNNGALWGLLPDSLAFWLSTNAFWL